MKWLAAVLLVAGGARGAFADEGDGAGGDKPENGFGYSGQANAIAQAQPGFHSPYAGTNSFRDGDHSEVSFVVTATGSYAYAATHTKLTLAIESAGGNGLSDALGIASFTNLDVVRNPSLGAAPYLARVYIDQDIPAAHLHIRAGKFSTVDLFDVNAIASDSHLQFMNWAVDNNGAYDYAADTRGYTVGAVVEFVQPAWTVRFGELAMPTVANGIDYDTDIAKARGENLEVEFHECLGGHAGIVRVLAYRNLAKMGNYNEALAISREDPTEPPDVTRTRVAGRQKRGAGVGIEQAIGHGVRLFGRVGSSEGGNESFAYTEIDNTVAAGGDLEVPHGKVGLALVTSGLSEPHRQYLAAGGSGFLLGDGRLHYGREDVGEAYFTWRAYKGVFPAVDVQVIDHPGFNTDRGPVVVGSVRLHVEL